MTGIGGVKGLLGLVVFVMPGVVAVVVRAILRDEPEPSPAIVLGVVLAYPLAAVLIVETVAELWASWQAGFVAMDARPNLFPVETFDTGFGTFILDDFRVPAVSFAAPAGVWLRAFLVVAIGGALPAVFRR